MSRGCQVPLEFRLLGEFTVLADGRRLDLGGPRQRSVLALLLLQRDRAIATATLADKLWPDDQPLSAIKTVQIYVSRLRDVLGPEAGRLSSTASGYRLAVADDEFDVARFERGVREAREASASGDQHGARATLDAAVPTQPELKEELVLYLSLVPGAVRQSLKRADDPTGRPPTPGRRGPRRRRRAR